MVLKRSFSVRVEHRMSYSNTVTKLLFPFADVICIFAEDFGGFGKAVARLGKWAATGSGTKPRVIIAYNQDARNVGDVSKLPEVSRLSSNPEILKYFSSVRVVSLGEVHLSSGANYRPLKEVLL